MKILAVILFLTLSILPSFGIWTRISHLDSLELDVDVDSIVTVYLSDFRLSKVKSEYNEKRKKVREFLYRISNRDLNDLHLLEKTAFTYDEKNRLVAKNSVRYDYYSEVGRETVKIAYKDDARGNKIEEYYQAEQYDNEYGKYKSKWKDKWKYSYDTKGNILEIVELSHDKHKRNRQVYRYAPEGYLLQKTKYSFYKKTEHARKKDWIEYIEEDSYYNISGVYKVFSCRWNPDKKQVDTAKIQTRVYNENLSVSQIEEQSFHEGKLSWGTKTNFIYDSSGTKKEEINYLWNYEVSVWNEQCKTVYTYNNNGNLLQETEYNLWSEKDSINFYPISKQISSVYDENGKMTARSKIVYTKHYQTKEWILNWKEEYELKEDRIIEKWYNFNVQAKEWFPEPYRIDTYYFSVEK